MTFALPRQGLWRGGAARGAAATVAVLGALVLVLRVHAAGQTLLAATLLTLTVLALWTYTSARTQALRYLFPGVAAALVFVVFPMLYTVGIGFTNYSSTHLLEEERARGYLLEETTPSVGSALAFSLHAEGERFRVRLEAAPAQPAFNSAALALSAAAPARQEATLHEATTALGPALPLRAVVNQLEALRELTLRDASGQALRLISLREFAQTRPLYVAAEGGALTDQITGITFKPDATEGFFTSAEGQRLTPGYRVAVGARHYVQMFSESKFREPFVSVFVWTVVFAALSIFFAAALGLLLAVLLNWEALQGKAAYRLVLFLPYAVPGFISILIFKGLFNQNLGEINLILHGLFGIRPAWFSDPLLAKIMLLTVNVWLGFPYMMVLCAGLIKSIPADLYEASAVAGAGPLTNFWRITLPLILKPLTPLLISAFAFNFNNFVLISLLTNGRPDQLDATLPAGTTDILVSYTWRIAFQDSGQQFGLAAAISTVIFLIVAAITLVQMRFTRIAK